MDDEGSVLPDALWCNAEFSAVVTALNNVTRELRIANLLSIKGWPEPYEKACKMIRDYPI